MQGVELQFQIRSLIAATAGVAACLAASQWFDVGQAGGLPMALAVAWSAGGLGGIAIASLMSKSKVLGGCIGGGIVPAAYYCATASWNLVPLERITFQLFVLWASGTIGGAALSAIVGVISEGMACRSHSAANATFGLSGKVAEPLD
jgi:hypothetical protein